MPIDVRKVQRVLREPPQGGRLRRKAPVRQPARPTVAPRPRPATQPRYQEPPETTWDFSKVQAYLPKEIREATPIQPTVRAYRPLTTKQAVEENQPAPPPAAELHQQPRAQEYQIGKPRPTPTVTGPQAVNAGIAEMALHEWRKKEASVAKAGQGDYRSFKGLADVFHNIGQLPGVGKGATAFLNAADLLFTVPAKAIERKAGDYFYDKVVPLKDELGVKGDPVKEQAFSAAMGIGYSKIPQIKQAYQDALQLAEQGQLTPENAEIVQAKHGTWWMEAIGQAVLDPLNVVDVIGVGGKAIKLSKWAKGGERLWTAPYLARAATKIDDLAETSEVIADFKKLTSVKGQVNEAEGLLDIGLSYLNPRLKHSVVHRQADRMAQVVDVMTGVSNKRAMVEVAEQGIAPGTAEFTQAVGMRSGEMVQQVAVEWARMAADEIDDVKDAAKNLKAMGYGEVPKSVMGRRFAVVLRRIAEKPNGEIGDLMGILNQSREQGLSAAHVSQAFYEKAAKVMDNMLPVTKWETGEIQAATAAVQKRLNPINRFFGALFMGLNPGYAMRNFYDNTGRMVLNSYSPLQMRVYEEITGIPVRGAERGIGQVGETTLRGLPFTRLAEKMEKWASARIANQAYGDSLRKLWPQALKGLDLSSVAPELRPVVRDMAFVNPATFDKLRTQPEIGAWKLIDDDLVRSLQEAGPDVYESVADILYRSDKVEDALTDLRGLQQNIVQHLAQETEAAKPMGPAMGTLTGHISDLLASTGKMEKAELEKLAEHLSGVEHDIRVSRNRAFAAAANSTAPEKFGAILEAAEKVFAEEVESITRRQLSGYVRLLTGNIDSATYTKQLKNIYNTAYQKLDRKYSDIIGGLEVGEWAAEADPIAVLRWALTREARKSGYGSWAIKGAGKAGDDIVHPAELAPGYLAPDAHFRNKIRQMLNYPEYTKIQDLDYDDLLAAINGFRAQRGKPALTIEQIIEGAQRSVPASAMPSFAAKPLREVPEDLKPAIDQLMQQRDQLFDAMEKAGPSVTAKLQAQTVQLDRLIDNMVGANDAAEVQRALKAAAVSTDPDVKQVAAALQGYIDVAPSPSQVDSVFYDAEHVVNLLDGVVDDVMETAAGGKNVPIKIDQELLTTLQGKWTEAQFVATEMARRARDYSLLDYADRRYFDPLLKVIFPWHYWYSRSVPNWAASIAARPNMVANYMKFKRELQEFNDRDPRVPDWAKDQLVVNIPGYPGQMYWNYEAAFNAIGAIYDTFEDPNRERDALGQLIQRLGAVGPAVHPLLVMAYAAERGLAHGEKDVMRSYGHLAPITKGFATLTGKTLEPWLWLQEPVTGERIPFTGGSVWDVEKGVRYLAEQQRQGVVPPEQAVLEAAQKTGPAYQQALQDITTKYRRTPVLMSLLLGMRVSTRQTWEDELANVNAQYWDQRNAGNDTQAQAILNANPWLGTMWMSWDNEATRIKNLANSVFARIPPLPGEQRDKMLTAAGITPQLEDMFWETTRGNPQGLTDWDRGDYEQLANGVLQLARLLGIPDRKTADEWAQAKRDSKAMYAELDENHPEIEQEKQAYFQAKEAGQEIQPSAELEAYWSDLNRALLANPLVLKYYQEPEKIDKIAESLAYEELERRHPNIFKLRAEQAQIPDDDWVAKAEFRRLHPEVNPSYDEFKEILKQIHIELQNLREYTKGTAVPETIEYLIQGKPTAKQRAVLQVIADMELENSKPTPPPELPAEKFTPEEKAGFETRDRIYAQVVEKFPEYPAQSRMYSQIRYVQGADAANLYANDVGLFDAWDYKRTLEVNDPIALAQLDDSDLEKAAKAAARAEAEKLWPGLTQTLESYYAIPESDKKGRANFRGEHPEVIAYWDWRKPAEARYLARYTQLRTQARAQERGFTLVPRE